MVDHVKAHQWFEKAAAQGDAKAQRNLGYLYEVGWGVPQDYMRAYMWYNLAAEHFLTRAYQKNAVKYRDEVARRMTPAQIAEAQRLSQQCQAQQFKGC